ncbi:biotin-dependent carboxyltransferase family protein [Pedobacter fastidiosus]|uniref:Biotin-dependent carboxyltransferase family protein n=1 Tax=Pedobacter fastidiosus TaxID=2765361 RepID=A0ABR7KUD8_9SPHI|nr:biotin-dependent carboxyltransferase family protein [Pedobacter fastidiosus]MBC6111440.1 biotin-dependent carboxyltransferase family protein [Pedobacter fastidiosus]
MEIKILKPGMLSSIQDLGRMDYLDQAIPVSGAMDQLSARIANKAVGNSDSDAVIEFTYAAAEFKAETEILIAYAGDGATLSVNGEKLQAERPIFIPSETVIKLVNNPDGARTYLAVAGGWNVPEVLGSNSTYLTAGFGGYGGRTLKAGDHLKSFLNLSESSSIILRELKGDKIKYLSWNIPKALLLPQDRKTIRVFPAKEFTWFDSQSIIGFLSDSFSIGLNSNRMGYHLEGNKINRVEKDELLSTAVFPGTIQVTGSGNLVLLMADCQTTGGYPRIAQVASVDLPLCAQLKPGNSIRFSEISKEEAEFLYIEREKELARLTLAINSRF